MLIHATENQPEHPMTFHQREGRVIVGDSEFVCTIDISDDEALLAEVWIRTPNTGSHGCQIPLGTIYAMAPPLGSTGCETLGDYLIREVLEYGQRSAVQFDDVAELARRVLR